LIKESELNSEMAVEDKKRRCAGAIGRRLSPWKKQRVKLIEQRGDNERKDATPGLRSGRNARAAQTVDWHRSWP